MPSILKAYHNTANGRIHYRFLSSGREHTNLAPIILLHMSASSSSSMEKMMVHLADLGYPTYAPDYPGFGSSSPPATNPANIAFYCNTVFDFCKAMNLKQFHIFGHHSGACIAVEMAVLFPEHILSICLIGPALMTLEERMAKFFDPFNEPVLDGSHLLKTWQYLEHLNIGDDIDLKQRETLDNLRAWKGRNQIYLTIWNQDCMDLFTKVTCPILCLIAENDVLIPFWHYIKELRPEVVAEVLSGRGGDFESENSDTEIELL